MYKCSVCGREFELRKQDHYICRDAGKRGILPAFEGIKENEQYDAFDCPFCGCQCIIGPRKIIDTNLGIHELKCTGCIHISKSVFDEPCVSCSSRYENHWEGVKE